MWISWNASTTSSHTRKHKHTSSLCTVWKQWSWFWRTAKIWLMQRKVPDTSAVGEPKLWILLQLLGTLLDVWLAMRSVSWATCRNGVQGGRGMSAYPHKRLRNLFPPSYCCCGTQSTAGCRWRWLVQGVYRHRNDLGHRWKHTHKHKNQDLIITTPAIALNVCCTALYSIEDPKVQTLWEERWGNIQNLNKNWRDMQLAFYISV